MTDETTPAAEPTEAEPKVAVESESQSPAAKEPDVPAATEQPGEPEAETPEHKPKPKVPFGERISQIHAARKQAEAQAIAAQQEAAQLRSELEALYARQADPNTPYEQQDADRLRQVVKEERFREKQAEIQRAQAQAFEARQATFLEKVAAAKDRMPDLAEKFSRVPVSDFAADLIAESDRAAELAYWLGSNIDEARRIHQLPPHRQGLELARIEARLSAAPTVRKVSKAPPPVPVVAGAAAASAKDPASMTDEEYSAWYRSRNKARR